MDRKYVQSKILVIKIKENKKLFLNQVITMILVKDIASRLFENLLVTHGNIGKGNDFYKELFPHPEAM